MARVRYFYDGLKDFFRLRVIAFHNKYMGYQVVQTVHSEIAERIRIERGHALLHSDRDFEPMERFLGLQTA